MRLKAGFSVENHPGFPRLLWFLEDYRGKPDQFYGNQPIYTVYVQFFWLSGADWDGPNRPDPASGVALEVFRPMCPSRLSEHILTQHGRSGLSRPLCGWKPGLTRFQFYFYEARSSALALNHLEFYFQRFGKKFLLKPYRPYPTLSIVKWSTPT